MRDPARIQKVMRHLTMLWETFPDMRFFQLMFWFENRAKEQFDLDDVFYLEDDQIQLVIDKIYADNLFGQLIKFPPNYWLRKYDIAIIDCDGWRDKDFDESITEEEFIKRVSECTCQGDLSKLKRK